MANEVVEVHVAAAMALAGAEREAVDAQVAVTAIHQVAAATVESMEVIKAPAKADWASAKLAAAAEEVTGALTAAAVMALVG